MKLTPQGTNLLVSYIVLQDLLGDLISKGEKYGSKQGMFPTKGESPKKEKYIPNILQRGKMPTGSSQHMREEQQIGGGTKGESQLQGEAKSTLDGGKHPSKCKWLNLSIFCKFMFIFIVLSSITKNGRLQGTWPHQAIVCDFGN